MSSKRILSLGHSHLATNGILKESSHFTWLSTSRQNIFARHEDYAQIVATLWTQSKIMIHETQHSKSSNLVAFLGWVELNSLSKSTFWTKIGLLAWKCSSLRSQYWMFFYGFMWSYLGVALIFCSGFSSSFGHALIGKWRVLAMASLHWLLKTKADGYSPVVVSVRSSAV